MVKLTAWLITVAIAAPLMPSEHPEINTALKSIEYIYHIEEM